MIVLLLLLCALSTHCSDESQENYQKYKDTGKDTELTTIDSNQLEGQLPDLKELPKGVTLKVYDKRGLTVSVDDKVILFIKDHITEIRLKKEEEKKDCTIL